MVLTGLFADQRDVSGARVHPLVESCMVRITTITVGAGGPIGPKAHRGWFCYPVVSGRAGRDQETASASYSPGGWPAGSRCLATREVGVRGRSSTACQ